MWGLTASELNRLPQSVTEVTLQIYLHLLHEGIWVTGGYRSNFLDLGGRWKGVISFTLLRSTRCREPHCKRRIVGWVDLRVGPETVQ
jgi:hypothetical protein